MKWAKHKESGGVYCILGKVTLKKDGIDTPCISYSKSCTFAPNETEVYIRTEEEFHVKFHIIDEERQ